MVVLLRAGQVAFPWLDHEREQAIVGTAVVLIPCDEENPAVLPSLQSRDLPHLGAQPAVPYGNGAVMRVMAHVWRDPGELRRPASQIGGQLCQRDHVRRTTSAGVGKGVVPRH